MNDNSQLISELRNRTDPLIDLRELIHLISKHTKKSYSKVADELEGILFGYRQNRSYTNAFCCCTIFDNTGADRTIYDKMTDNLKNAFDYIKWFLQEVIFNNSINVDKLDLISVRASEVIALLQANNFILKQAEIQVTKVSQNRADYISVYDLVEWAKANYKNSYYDTADDLIRLLEHHNVALYRQFTGIKPSIEKDNQTLLNALSFIRENCGYKSIDIDFGDDVPF